jgi:hypothetical protein
MRRRSGKQQPEHHAAWDSAMPHCNSLSFAGRASRATEYASSWDDAGPVQFLSQASGPIIADFPGFRRRLNRFCAGAGKRGRAWNKHPAVAFLEQRVTGR